MTIDSVGSFLDTLRQYKLLPPGQLDELARGDHGRFPDARGLAKYLAQISWLTVYQVNELLQGRGADLALGPYRIQDRLGQGGVSQVFKAWDTKRNRVVALKRILPELLSRPEAVGRFQREMRVVTHLNHPNIARAFDDRVVGDTHYIAMEFVEGTDLNKLVELSGALPVATACDYTRQAALALQYAHEKGLVHRDVKPANLLVTREGVVKVLDLGLARLAIPTVDDQPLTLEGMLIGSPDYMAPEQARDARFVDARADVYGLGCTGYYLLTGQVPFPGNSLMHKLVQHRQAEPPDAAKLRPEAPAALAAVLRKMMAKRPEDRFPTPAAAADALQPFCRPG